MSDNEDFYQNIYESNATKSVLSMPSKKLHSIPELSGLHNLTIIYFQDNEIKFIPEDFFSSLPNLMWLDMRNNVLKGIPKSIQNHQKLANFLLQNNKITALPNELGTVPNLKVLQLSGNPVEYPPEDIIKAGTPKILTFLRDKFLNETLESPSNFSDKTIDFENSNCQNRNSSLNFKSKSRNNLSVQFTEKENDSDEEQQYSKNDGKCPKLAKSRSKTFLCSQSSKYLKPLRVPTKSKQDEKMRDAFLKKLAIKKQKEINAATETILQGRRHKEYLRNWRQTYRNKQMFMTNQNLQHKLKDFPYDTNAEFMTILTRADIEKDLPDKYRRKLVRKSKQSVPRRSNEDVLLAMKIKQLFENLEAIDLNRQCMTPRSEQKALLGEIHKITEIKQKLKELSTAKFTSV